MSSSIPAIRVVDLEKSFGPLVVLRGVSFEVPRGGVFSMIGASGSGKSTLLRCINFLETPTRGRDLHRRRADRLTRVAGRQAAPALERRRSPRCARELGMVFQQFNLWPHMTVLGNVIEAPIRVRGMPRDAAEALGARVLAQRPPARQGDDYPARLSGGQQQRVAIARALAMQPKVMLFDEPTSSLDPELTDEVLGVMRELADDGTTMIVVTHEMSFAREVSDRVLFLHNGIVEEEGPPEQVFGAPRSERCRQFLSKYLQ